MKYDYIVMNGNWSDRVDTILEHEDIDKGLIVSIKIVWDISDNTTRFCIYSRGLNSPAAP